jgi:hypothetical protein
VGADSDPSYGARIIYHRANDLPIQRDSVPDGQNTFPVQEGTQRTQNVNCFLSDLMGVRLPCESYI